MVSKKGVIFCIFSISMYFGEHTAEQKYIFQADNIKIVLSAKQNSITHEHDLIFEIDIYNNSDNDMFFLSKEKLVAIPQKDSNVLYVSYGEDYSSIETEVELLKLDRGKQMNHILEVPYSKLEESFKFKSFFIELGIGYIPSRDSIKKYEHLSNIKLRELQNRIILSSIVVDASLKRLNMGGLKFDIIRE